MKVNFNEVQVHHNKEQQRFEITIDDETALASYSIEGNMMIFTHTKTPPALQGNGLASKIAQNALDYARAYNYQVKPACSFFRDFIASSPEYQDLL